MMKTKSTIREIFAAPAAGYIGISLEVLVHLVLATGILTSGDVWVFIFSFIGALLIGIRAFLNKDNPLVLLEIFLFIIATIGIVRIVFFVS